MYPVGWPARVAADHRFERIRTYGSVLATDWMTRVLAQMIQTDVVATRDRLKVYLPSLMIMPDDVIRQLGGDPEDHEPFEGLRLVRGES